MVFSLHDTPGNGHWLRSELAQESVVSLFAHRAPFPVWRLALLIGRLPRHTPQQSVDMVVSICRYGLRVSSGVAIHTRFHIGQIVQHEQPAYRSMITSMVPPDRGPTVVDSPWFVRLSSSWLLVLQVGGFAVNQDLANCAASIPPLSRGNAASTTPPLQIPRHTLFSLFEKFNPRTRCKITRHQHAFSKRPRINRHLLVQSLLKNSPRLFQVLDFEA